MVLLVELYHIFQGRNNAMCNKPFQKIEKRENSDRFEASISPISKPDKDIKKKITDEYPL